MVEKKIVSVFGGNGFIGKYLVDSLLSKGYYVNIISRNAKFKKVFFPSSKLGQFALINCNIMEIENISSSIKGSTIVINLAGILETKKNNSFQGVHIEGAKNLALACKKNKVEKLIHISALGIDRSKTSNYAFSKLKGEKNIKEFNDAVIIRPSVVCGEEDNFINFFARFARISPFIPLIGGGITKFQPVHVTDLVNIIMFSIEDKSKKGQLIELGGPDILSFKQILEYINYELKLKRKFLNLPFNLAKKLAFFSEMLPISILTRDQVELLKTNNTVNKKYSHKVFYNYEPHSFYVFAKKQLNSLRSDGGHIN